MTEGVTGDVAVLQSGTVLFGVVNRQRESERDAVSAQRFAGSVGEDDLGGIDRIRLAPFSQLSLRRRPNWHRPLLATFALEMNGPADQVLRPELQRFGNPSTGVVQEQEE